MTCFTDPYTRVSSSVTTSLEQRVGVCTFVSLHEWPFLVLTLHYSDLIILAVSWHGSMELVSTHGYFTRFMNEKA